MKPHFSEADLLETYYTRPGESMPVMMHLADCADCAARYERLERKVRGLAACEHEKPESFWARQRTSIMRRIAAEERPPALAWSVRLAAAAVLVLVFGGVLTWTRSDRSPAAPAQTATTVAATQPAVGNDPARAVDTSSNPWQSDELKEFGTMVAWEAWVETEENGDQSL